jgi:MFS family permease
MSNHQYDGYKALHPAMLRWLTFRFLIIFTSYCLYTSLCFLLYEKTRSPLALGYAGLAELIPAVGFALFAGHIADKNAKQKLIRVIAVSYIVLALVLLLNLGNADAVNFEVTKYTAIIYTAIFCTGLLKASLAPVSFSILHALSPPQKITTCISYSTSAWYSGAILGPLAAGWLLGTCEVSTILIIILCLYITCALLAFSLNRLPEAFAQTKDASIWQSLAEGIRFVGKNKLILGALSLDLFAVLFGGAESMLPAVNKEILLGDSITFGWLRSAHGLGSIALMIILVFVPLQKRAGPKLFFSVAGFGLCVIVFGLSKNFYLSFVVLFIGGMLDNVSVIIRQYVLQTQTPEQIRGRVASVNSIFISSSNELGALESGIAASLFGLSQSIVIGGCITVSVALVVYLYAKELRHLRIAPST